MNAHAESSRPAPPEPKIVDGRFVPTRDVPFSETLDQLIAEIRDGKAPNLGIFCDYCCTPLAGQQSRCPTCGTALAEHPPREKISRTLARIYTAKRKREARYVHGAAWSGILIGAAISIGLIIALPGWTKIFAIVFLIIGSYYVASYLGNVLVQGHAYRSGLRLFARHWHEYAQARRTGTVDDD